MKFDAKPLSVNKQRKLISVSRLKSSGYLDIVLFAIFLISTITFLINNYSISSYETRAQCPSLIPTTNQEVATNANVTSNKSDKNTVKKLNDSEINTDITSKDVEYVAETVIVDSSPFNYDTIQPVKQSYNFTDFSKSLNKTGRQFWESIKPSFNCPTALLTKLGGPKIGGKWTCGIDNLAKASIQSEKSPCIVYSFGVNGESSFEADILASTHCQVFAFDPTVDQIGKPLRASNRRVQFKKLGISGDDDVENLQTLKSILKDDGDRKWIDILKMDVDHAEYPSLGRILKDFPVDSGGNRRGLPFGQLLVKMHLRTNLKGKIYGGEQVISLFKQLEKSGLRMFHKEIDPELGGNLNCEFSFINTDQFTLERVLGNELYMMV